MATGVAASKISVKNLHDYLKTLSPAVLDKLYNHPATSLAVFRELPELAQQYIVRLLFVEQPITQAVVTSWVNPQYYKEHQASVQALKNLQLWSEVSMPGGLPGWLLHGTFRKNTKTALLGGGKPWSTTASLEPDKYAKDITFLDKYAMERWEAILHYMVGGTQPTEGISGDTAAILIHAGLMKSEEDSATPVITSDGFQFLLMETCSQVWYFMLQYLDTVESRNLNLVDCLSFVFQLSFSMLGKDYTTEGMNESMLGIWPRISKKDAYLQKALVALFSESLYSVANANIGIITRDSVRQALRSGITADQIITFLRTHAHPEQLKQTPVIPSVITDQIKLWELERDRFRFTDGVLYSQFLSQEDFECLRNYAQDLGVLVWESTPKRVMIVSRAGHDDVKRFWKRQKNS
uniref:General transcription factor IIH subunit 4 n=1 Tax=Strigamia maritima TaxID=126957 RepID=T1IVL1_STRMM